MTKAKGDVMKTIPVEQLSARLTDAIEHQDEHEAIALTKGAGTVAWLVRVPEALKDSEADWVFYTEGPAGQIVFVVQAKHGSRAQPDAAVCKPVFGAGRGTLTIVSEDDEHLEDFAEYME
ncbi:MAG TPA: hypothetical protein VG269_18690 [Tepidisphaeraceae bacterium]|nr:hypothetical protein [Tepidisphaeraceae bacterium]